VVESKAAEFMATAGHVSVAGNTPWASGMAREVIGVVRRATERAPRSLQVHLGPSEIGVECDRQVVGKLLRLPSTNHVSDPWPSFVGTAVHAELAAAFEQDNAATGVHRWFTETRVEPHPNHRGTADLYDAVEQAVLDHKCLGESSMAKVRAGKIPRKYRRQLFLYGLGYLRAGRPVRRVALIAYPRTGSSLDGVYVWETPFDGQAVAELAETFMDMDRRNKMAAGVRDGAYQWRGIPMAPDDDECYFCPFYRPQAARDGGEGCPGPRPVAE
jgi:hypothetical protein